MKKFLLVVTICLSCIISFQDKVFAKNISDKKTTGRIYAVKQNKGIYIGKSKRIV